MRVLFVLEDLRVGGAQRHALDLAAGLSGRFHCMVLAAGDADPALASIGGDALGLRPLHPENWPRLGREIGARRPDLIVAANPVAALASACACALVGLRAPRMTILHSTRLAGASGWIRMIAAWPAIRRSQALVYVSERQGALWRRRGFRGRRTLTILNGVDAERFVPVADEQRRAARERLGFLPADVVFCTAAALRWEKNIPQLAACIGALRGEGLPARLLVIGDGPARAAVEAAMSPAGAADALTLVGLQSDIRPFLAAADAGALPSTAVETLSLFALEIMASGLPMILSDIGGARELITPGEDGLLVAAGDEASLKAALQALLDPAERGRLGAAGRRTVERRFTRAAMIARYAALFDSLLAERR